MSEVVVVKGPDGKLHGMGAANERAFAKFLRRVASLCAGETLWFSWREPRSPRHHAFFFAMLGQLLDRQERFEDEHSLRTWLIVGAGFCEFLPGPKGQLVAIPRSIKWALMDEAEFDELHRRVRAFLWTDHARQLLWPHLTALQTYEQVEALSLEFS